MNEPIILRQKRASYITKSQDSLLSFGEEYHTWCMGLLCFNRPFQENELRDVVQEKMLKAFRLRSRYDFDKSRFEELSLDDIDLQYHVKWVEGPVKMKDVLFNLSYPWQLNGKTGQIFGKADLSKPLWQVRYFKDVQGQGSCLVTCISHIVGDGVSQVSLLYSLMDQEQVESVNKGGRASKKSIPALKKASVFLRGAMSAAISFISGEDTASPMKPLTRTAGGLKSVFITPHIMLTDIKAIRKKIPDITVNDVLVALLNHCIISYLNDNMEKEKSVNSAREFYLNFSEGGIKLSATFPCNMRTDKEMMLLKGAELNNNVSLASVDLILKYVSFSDLLQKMKKKLDAVKLSPVPLILGHGCRLFNATFPRSVCARMMLDYQTRSTAILSNIKGPANVVTIAGKEVHNIQFSMYGCTGTYFGLISYAGKVSCCISADANVLNADELGKFWVPGFENMWKEIFEE
eukprot:snap_masked-scaffold_15-processed-gene-3.23-mRNA-1 protein AED:1.00 eAED:1.00 QI:0/-1/0/0/-1/1/1/0/461